MSWHMSRRQLRFRLLLRERVSVYGLAKYFKYINLPAASRGVPVKENTFYRSKLRAIKPSGFRIALKVMSVIRVICEIRGLKQFFR